MKTFLKLNRWIYIAPFALYLIPVSPLNEIFAILGSVLIMFWMYAVSTYGQKQLSNYKLPENNIKLFKLTFVAVPMLILTNNMIAQWILDLNNSLGAVIFVFLVLATIFSVLYLYYFTAKTITTIERKRKVTLNECYNNFILIGLSGVGVFFLQPKIQKLINTDNIN